MDGGGGCVTHMRLWRLAVIVKITHHSLLIVRATLFGAGDVEASIVRIFLFKVAETTNLNILFCWKTCSRLSLQTTFTSERRCEPLVKRRF